MTRYGEEMGGESSTSPDPSPRSGPRAPLTHRRDFELIHLTAFPTSGLRPDPELVLRPRGHARLDALLGGRARRGTRRRRDGRASHLQARRHGVDELGPVFTAARNGEVSGPPLGVPHGGEALRRGR
uniref:Uncharacterized protein n=1 Tax=Arundo donax TaxID=35708 RepID=A0A0A9GKN5_ARUDO